VGARRAVERDVKSGSPDLGDQPRELSEAGLGLDRRVPGFVEEGKQAAHLAHRLAAGGLDGLEGVACRCTVAVGRALAGDRLDHDEADAVGDDVVKLARHPLALLGDGLAGAFVLLGLEPRSLLGEQRGTDPAPVDRTAEGEPDDDEDEREEHVARPVDGGVGEVVDRDGAGGDRRGDQGTIPIGGGGVDGHEQQQERAGAFGTAADQRLEHEGGHRDGERPEREPSPPRERQPGDGEERRVDAARPGERGATLVALADPQLDLQQNRHREREHHVHRRNVKAR
jgi:hypothetical protein